MTAHGKGPSSLVDRMKKYGPMDLSGLHTYSLFDRASKVTTASFARPVAPGATLADFLTSLPDQLLGRDFPELVGRVLASRDKEKPVIAGMGAHVIKVGLNPVLIDLMERRLITGLAMNGACVVHDVELAMAGKTSEDVAAELADGAFGAARETGEVINEAIRLGSREQKGLGQALGDWLLARDYPYNNLSLLASAAKLGIPVTVHVAVGTDIVHIHPSADGAAIGDCSHRDFRIFCSMVADLEQGCYLNFGSAVILPEVFLKALTAVRNLGHLVNDFTTANFDFIRHYRPLTNVVQRPTSGGGKGYHLTGHHELMIPLFAACLVDGAAAGRRGEDAAL